MTTQTAYKKRLREHLSETKRHGREVKKRIKQLGGAPVTVDTPGPAQVGEAAQAVVAGAQKAVALAQGPLHALRGTGQEEKHLKNAKTEYASESEEIAMYTAIEVLADVVMDKDTAKLARSIRREEERMRSYLEKAIPRLTKEMAKAEIPTRERGKPGRATRKPARKKTPTRRAQSTTAARSKAAQRH
jgi:ferritin-like metal-binding protein YciE